ncbi:MAG TPA: hypothetical protein PK156_49120 [Polyangium sp.]|nr:hypothetical protein [Polyangium sp.]
MTHRRILGILPIVAALSALVPADAIACGNVVLATDKAIATVKEAEKLLNDGNPAEARLKIEALMNGASGFDEQTPSAKGLANRANRIISLANVRIDDRKGEGRRVILGGAVYFLSRIAKDNPNDAAKMTDLGEALAKTNPPKAKKILEDLAARDIMTTPYAYAALARLRAADGDEKGRDDAVAKCKQMAKVESICKLEQPKSGKS